MTETPVAEPQMTMPSWAILKLLASGHDPVTGLPHNIEALNAPAVRKALSEGVEALIAANAPAQPTGKADAKAVKTRKPRKPRESKLGRGLGEVPKAAEGGASAGSAPGVAGDNSQGVPGTTPPATSPLPQTSPSAFNGASSSPPSGLGF